MAGIGLRKPYYAIYNYIEGGVPYYSGGGIMAKAIDFSASIESGNDNNLYADDGIAESDRTFAGGTISITTDDLLMEPSAAILGMTPHEISVGDAGAKVMELVYDESMSAPYLGFGVIIPKQSNNIKMFRAVVFPKIMFSVPEDAAATKGDSIEWKTPTIEGTILRSDAEGHPWKREATVSSEALAEAYIRQNLQISSGTLGELTVISAAGTAAGNTKLTITPAKAADNSYRYKVETLPKLPAYGDLCAAGYTAWDGSAEIAAASGQKIVVVEVDADHKAKKAGIAVVTAKA